MSHFEFIAIAISIIFAMTLGRLVAGLPQVAGRSPPDYLQLAFLITLIAHQILLWWRMWMLSSIEQWNFLGYFLMVVAPLSYYLTAIALVDSPETRNPDRGFSHRWFFSALAAAWTYEYSSYHSLLGAQALPWRYSMSRRPD